MIVGDVADRGIQLLHVCNHQPLPACQVPVCLVYSCSAMVVDGVREVPSGSLDLESDSLSLCKH